MSRRLAVVVAHPDDDTFGASGTVALHADDPEFRFGLVHATSGEAGMISGGSDATRTTLGEVREQEDRRSWQVLGREPDRHEWLRYPDGGLSGVPFEELVDRITTILSAERPDVVITFGPEGITDHPDHKTVGRATTEAFHRLRSAGTDGFRRLLHTSIRASAIEEWNRRLTAAGKEPIDTTKVFNPRGVPDETIGVDVDCSAVVGKMLVALTEHRTQAGDIEDWSEDELVQAMARETHVVAWPPREAGARLMGDVFEEL